MIYQLLGDSAYIEIDGPLDTVSMAWDKYPVISDRRDVIDEIPEYNYFAQRERGDRAAANFTGILAASGNLALLRNDYRHLYVVHTMPMAPYAQAWKDKLVSIADIISPEMCVAELEKPGKVSMFDFCERYMDRLDGKGKGTG
jgi:chromo domain-containing protein 1